jgi:hypothetical protein
MKNDYTIYTCEINVNTLEFECDSILIDDGFDPDPDEYGEACYNDFIEDSVYAESLVSEADAKRVVLEKCRELAAAFSAAAEVVAGNSGSPA